jgi:hypothetical protein
LIFRTLGQGRAYWVFRYRAGGKEREVSLGPYPGLGLADARVKHTDLRKRVLADNADPLADKRAARTAPTATSGSWKPGQTANPNGRPLGSRNNRTADIVKRLMALGIKTLETLSELQNNSPDEAIRATAANMLAP